MLSYPQKQHYQEFFTIFDGESNTKTQATSPGYQFYLVWPNPQISIVSHSYILAGFKIGRPNKALSYSSSLQSVTQSGGTFYYNPTKNISEIVYAQFAVILLKTCGVPFYIGLIDLPLTIFNMPNRTVSHQKFTNLPLPNYATTGQLYATKVLISSVSLLSFIIYNIGSYTSTTSSTIQITIGSTYEGGCVFNQIKLTYLFLAKSLTKQYNYVYTHTTYSQQATQLWPLGKFFPNGTNNCFIGLYQIIFINITVGTADITVTVPNDIIGPSLYTIQKNLSNISYKIVMTCLSHCLATEFPDSIIGTGVCFPCSKLMANCQTCNSSGHCLTCLSGYFLFNTTTNRTCTSCLSQCLECSITNSCLLCSQSRLVKGGCSIDPGCIQVDSTLTYLDNSCIACKIEGNLQLVNGTCKCKSGYSEVNSLCILDAIGCVNAIQNNNTVSCLLCSQNLDFKLYPVNGICVCKNGYILINESCIQVCGDGIRSKHQCDDGNILSGDGCSSDCRIEVDFDCYGNKANHSVCIYLRKDIKLELISISKIYHENIGVFRLKITPKIWINNKINASSIIFSTNRSYSSQSIVISQNEIQISVRFSESLEGFQASVTLQLGTPYFLQQETSISFSMTSGNSKLIMAQNQQNLGFVTFIFEGISWAVLVLFGASVFVHKMIGLELLQNLQIIYLVHLINQNYTTPFSVFMFLTNLGYNFLFHSNMGSNIDSSKSNVEFDPKNFSFSQIILFGSIIISATISGVFLLFSNPNWLQLNNSSDQNTEKSKLEDKRRNIKYFIYNRIEFPLSVGSMFLFFLVLGRSSNNQNSSAILILAIFLSTILLSKVYFIQLRTLFFQSRQQQILEIFKCDIRYVGFYLIFQLIVSIILTSSFVIKQITPEYYLPPVYFIFILLMLIYRPYKNWIHNLGAIFGVITTLSFLLWCTIRNIFPKALIEKEEMLVINFILLLIALNFFFSIWRIILELKSTKKKKREKKNQTKLFQNCQRLEEQIQSIQINQLNKKEIKWKYQRTHQMKDNQQHRQILIPSDYYIEKSKTSRHLQERKLLRQMLSKQSNRAIDPC